MRSSIGEKTTALLASLLLLACTTSNAASPVMSSPPLPNPVLVLTGMQFFQANGKQWTRYQYTVDNFNAYPNDLFAAAPALPPCGLNKKSARTWVDFYSQNGKRLYGFCALGNHDGLRQLWFAMESDVVPPSWVYIEMNDRQTNTKYKSNLAETVL
jgi:hypothetical protein